MKFGAAGAFSLDPTRRDVNFAASFASVALMATFTGSSWLPHLGPLGRPWAPRGFPWTSMGHSWIPMGIRQILGNPWFPGELWISMGFKLFKEFQTFHGKSNFSWNSNFSRESNFWWKSNFYWKLALRPAFFPMVIYVAWSQALTTLFKCCN